MTLCNRYDWSHGSVIHEAFHLIQNYLDSVSFSFQKVILILQYYRKKRTMWIGFWTQRHSFSAQFPSCDRIGTSLVTMQHSETLGPGIHVVATWYVPPSQTLSETKYIPHWQRHSSMVKPPRWTKGPASLQKLLGDDQRSVTTFTLTAISQDSSQIKNQ